MNKEFFIETSVNDLPKKNMLKERDIQFLFLTLKKK